MKGAFLAVDWGTTNRRVYVIGAEHEVIETRRDDHGILSPAITSFADDAAGICATFGHLPMVCAGMIGSNRGWREVPYVPAPAGLAHIAAGCCWIEPGRIAILPGVSCIADGRADVMRGEEIQFLGADAAGLVPGDALLCQPGTHAKWATLAGERITGITTAMTGEMFALLKRHSLLADQLGGDVADSPAFRQGVEAAARGDLLADLFGARASRLLGLRAMEDHAAYVSGLLIGADVAARLRDRHRHVGLLADDTLGPLYAAAIEMNGGTTTLIDSQAAFVAGITRIWEILP